MPAFIPDRLVQSARRGVSQGITIFSARLGRMVCLLLAISPPLAASHAAGIKTPGPNILWIVMDDVGAELPCYGEKTIDTPNIEWDPKIYDGSDLSQRKPSQPFFAQIQLWGGKNRNDNGRWYREIAPKALGTLTKPEDVRLPPYYPRDPIMLDDWAQYLDCIRFCDQQVGEILQRLETEGILDQTYIILMGDNGISQPRRKQFLYDEGTRTPFIVRGPGIARGAVREDLIEHIDMAATSLAWAGQPVPPWMQGRDIFANDYQKCDAVFAARDRCGETVDGISSVRTGQFKYIRNFFSAASHAPA